MPAELRLRIRLIGCDCSFPPRSGHSLSLCALLARQRDFQWGLGDCGNLRKLRFGGTLQPSSPDATRQLSLDWFAENVTIFLPQIRQLNASGSGLGEMQVCRCSEPGESVTTQPNVSRLNVSVRFPESARLP